MQLTVHFYCLTLIIHSWCAANCMKLNNDKTQVITFTRKTNSINHNYKLCDKCIIHTNSIREIVLLLDSKLFFTPHCSLNMFSVAQNFGIRNVRWLSFSTIHSLLLLYFTVVRSKVECVSPVWNKITATDANKLHDYTVHQTILKTFSLPTNAHNVKKHRVIKTF